MTEAELWHMHLLAVENSTTSMESVLTILFAYLAAAHFAGPRLTRFQAVLVSAFFVLAAAVVSFMALVEFRRAAFFMRQLSSRFGVESISPNEIMVPLFAVVIALAVAASLLFMWQARRNVRPAASKESEG